MKTISGISCVNLRCACGRLPAGAAISAAALRQQMSGMRGFSLISTLFLLVVVSSLAAYMVSLATAQHTASALSAQYSRARYAAASGLEWVAYEIHSNPGACPPVPTSFTAEGFSIVLKACARNAVTESGGNYALYDVTVAASRGSFGSPDYVSRSFRATINE